MYFSPKITSFEGRVPCLNRLRAGLMWGGLVFAPWAFGSTQTWAIIALNLAGTLLGMLWLADQLPHAEGKPKTFPPRDWTTICLAVATVMLLLYSLLAALNAQSAFDAASGAFRPLPHFDWLPRSCDRAASWLAFWQNLALAGTFWAVRDWLLQSPGTPAVDILSNHTGLLPKRARTFLFFLATNGFLLAVVALLQRLDGTNKLLWLRVPHINQTADGQFGPFAYRSNGLQYLALVWPLALASWSMLTHAQRDETLVGSGRRGWLLLCALAMAICPLLWASRLGVAVAAAMILLAAAILLRSHPVSRRRIIFLAGFGGIIALGLILNGHGLVARFSAQGLHSDERMKLLRAGLDIFRENWLWGTGPGSFPAMYFLYRPDNHAVWLAQMHCDWLQTLATYGVAGSILLGAALVALIFSPAQSGKLPARTSFILLIGLGLAGCLAHATVDFPFQIYAIQHLFVMLAAFFSTLSVKP